MADKKIKGITIAMQADTSGVAKGLKDVTAESVKFSAQLKQVEALLKLDPTNTDLLAEREKLLSASTEKTAEKLSMLRAAQEDVNKAFAKGKINDSEYIAFQNELVRTEQRLQSLQQQAQKTKTPLEALESTIADQKKKLSELGKEYQNAALSEGQNSDAAKALEQQYKQLDSELKTNQAQLKSSQDAAASLSAEEEKALTPLESLKATISDQKKELDRLSDEYKNAVLSEGENSDAAKELAKQMRSLTAEQKDNQKQLDDLENATENATGTTDDFDDSVKELGNDSEKASGGISAATIAIGEFLGNLAMDAVHAAIDAIQALGSAAVDAVKDIGSVVAETAEYGDNIDKASQKIGISAEAYQEWDFILQHSGASADVLQSSVKKLSTQMDNAMDVIHGTTLADEELERQFASGEITSEEYAEAYNKLYDEAYQGIEAFEALGYSMSDLENMSSTEELLSSVIGRLQNMEEGTERTALATTLLGKGAMEMGALFNTSAEDTEAMRLQIHELGGVMSDEAVKSAAAYQDSLQNMQTVFDGIKRELASGFLPAVTEIMDGLSDVFSGAGDSGMEGVVSGVNDFIQQLGTAAESVGDIAKGILPAISSGIAQSLPEILSAAGELAAYFSENLLPDIEPTITAIVSSLKNAFPKILNLSENFINSLTSGVLSALPDLIPLAADLVMTLVQGIVTALPRIAEATTTMVDAILTSLTNVLPDLIPAAVQAVVTIVQGLVRNIPKLIEGALQLVGALADGLAAGLPVLLDALPDIIIGLVSGLLSHVGEIVQAGIMLLTGLVGALPEIISTILQIIPEIITSLTENLLSHIGDMIDTGITLLVALVDALPDIINAIVEVLPDIITAVIDALLTCIPQLVRAGVRLLTALVDNLPEIIGQIIAVIPQIVASVSSALIAKYPEIREMGLKLFVELIAKSAEIIRKLLEMPNQIIEHVKSAFMERFGDMQRIGMELFDNIANGIKSVLGGAWTWGTDLIDNFVGGIRDKIGHLADIAADCAETVRSFLGFSEPEEGPLSNFHTFAPDMMELFAQGIKENEHLIADQFRKSLGNIGIAADLTAMSPAMVAAGGGVVNNYYNNDNSQTFTQNNTSPKALSRWELNRQARNILELAKR